LRELYEETSVRSVSLLAEAPEWYAYDLPTMVAGRAWRGRYRGQNQKWFAFRFEGDDSEINIHQPGGGHHRPDSTSGAGRRCTGCPSDHPVQAAGL
jgi:putative (di)nucleoside polyphosphate hydrolase